MELVNLRFDWHPCKSEDILTEGLCFDLSWEISDLEDETDDHAIYMASAIFRIMKFRIKRDSRGRWEYADGFYPEILEKMSLDQYLYGEPL
jgi:hypothetical protein